jgi:hypothetical protein
MITCVKWNIDSRELVRLPRGPNARVAECGSLTNSRESTACIKIN